MKFTPKYLPFIRLDHVSNEKHLHSAILGGRVVFILSSYLKLTRNSTSIDYSKSSLDDKNKLGISKMINIRFNCCGYCPVKDLYFMDDILDWGHHRLEWKDVRNAAQVRDILLKEN